MRKHLDKYMIHYTNLSSVIDMLDTNHFFCADTESCFTTQELFDAYTNNQKPDFKGDAVKVYAWALSNTGNDYVIYGETLDSFFSTIEKICYSKNDYMKMSETKCKRIQKQMKMNLFIHNLGWDLEFFKYYLLRSGYSYYNSVVKDNKKVNQKNSPMSFNIVENKNTVYSMQMNMHAKKLSYRKKHKGEFIKINTEVFPQVEFFDFFKILAFPLDAIGQKIIDIDEKFRKLTGQYDYDAIRPDGHILDEEAEIPYLHNDVYVLKEAVRQFWLPMGTEKKTASGIAFESYMKSKYGDDKPMKEFIKDYPDLSPQVKIFSIIHDSYRGGWTQANQSYKGKHLKGINGTSIDINSSYPAIISGHLKLNDKYEGTPLPFGEPKLYEGYNPCPNNKLNLLTIEFDSFYNKDMDNLIGELQVGARNSEIFNRIGTDYIATNIIDGKPVGSNGKSKTRRFRITVWEFELESILRHTVFEDYEVISTLTFDSNIGHFREQVEFYNEQKIEGKRIGNKLMQTQAKLVNNSVYGKFASTYERVERMVTLSAGTVKNVPTDIYYESDSRYYPAFASCVTAWARTNLRDTLYTIGYNNVLYFDTDSLYTLLPLEEVERVMGDKLDAFILGKWDIEKQYKEFKTIGSKKYMVLENNDNLVCKCAGLPSDVRDTIKFEFFELGNAFDGKKMKTKLPGGYALIESQYIMHEFSLNR